MRQKFKVNIFSDRVKAALSESFLPLNICRVVFENFDLEDSITVRVRRGIRVQVQYIQPL